MFLPLSVVLVEGASKISHEGAPGERSAGMEKGFRQEVEPGISLFTWIPAYAMDLLNCPLCLFE